MQNTMKLTRNIDPRKLFVFYIIVFIRSYSGFANAVPTLSSIDHKNEGTYPVATFSDGPLGMENKFQPNDNDDEYGYRRSYSGYNRRRHHEYYNQQRQLPCNGQPSAGAGLSFAESSAQAGTVVNHGIGDTRNLGSRSSSSSSSSAGQSQSVNVAGGPFQVSYSSSQANSASSANSNKANDGYPYNFGK